MCSFICQRSPILVYTQQARANIQDYNIQEPLVLNSRSSFKSQLELQLLIYIILGNGQ